MEVLLNKLPIYPLSLYEQRKRRSRFDVIDLTNNGNMTDRERKIFESRNQITNVQRY